MRFGESFATGFNDGMYEVGIFDESGEGYVLFETPNDRAMIRALQCVDAMIAKNLLTCDDDKTDLFIEAISEMVKVHAEYGI